MKELDHIKGVEREVAQAIEDAMKNADVSPTNPTISNSNQDVALANLRYINTLDNDFVRLNHNSSAHLARNHRRGLLRVRIQSLWSRPMTL